MNSSIIVDTSIKNPILKLTENLQVFLKYTDCTYQKQVQWSELFYLINHPLPEEHKTLQPPKAGSEIFSGFLPPAHNHILARAHFWPPMPDRICHSH